MTRADHPAVHLGLQGDHSRTATAAALGARPRRHDRFDSPERIARAFQPSSTIAPPKRTRDHAPSPAMRPGRRRPWQVHPARLAPASRLSFTAPKGWLGAVLSWRRLSRCQLVCRHGPRIRAGVEFSMSKSRRGRPGAGLKRRRVASLGNSSTITARCADNVGCPRSRPRAGRARLDVRDR